jgi:methylglutaconyl-CoA hydratase
MDGELVLHQRRDGAAILTLHCPHKRNALSRIVVSDLLAGLEEARADPSVRLVVLTGTGTTFCSGADLSDPPVTSGPGSYADMFGILWNYPKPLVAAVNGHVRAGGLGLVAASDYVIAVDTATFAATEVRLGLVPALVAVMCMRKMSVPSAHRYLLIGETFHSADAAACGLVGRVVPDGQIQSAVEETVREFRQCEPIALAATKELLRAIPGLSCEEGFALAGEVSRRFFGSQEIAEGIAALKEKRPPRWAISTG